MSRKFVWNPKSAHPKNKGTSKEVIPRKWPWDPIYLRNLYALLLIFRHAGKLVSKTQQERYLSAPLAIWTRPKVELNFLEIAHSTTIEPTNQPTRIFPRKKTVTSLLPTPTGNWTFQVGYVASSYWVILLIFSLMLSSMDVEEPSGCDRQTQHVQPLASSVFPCLLITNGEWKPHLPIGLYWLLTKCYC